MIVTVLLVVLIASTKAAPVDNEFFETFEDPAAFEDSQPDETKSFVHTYGDKKNDDDEKGYHRTTENKGSDGYKHFDSYHKKDGDKYGFEKHSAYGNANHGAYDGGSAGGSSKAASSSDSDGKGSKVNYQYIEPFDSDDHADYNDGFLGSYTDGHNSDSYLDSGSSYGGPAHYESGGRDGDNDGFDGYHSHYTSHE